MNALDEIRQLYHSTTKATIQRDLTKAIALLKTLGTEDDRERAAVYMDGLSQMRSEWGVRPEAATVKPKKAAAPAKAAASRRPAATSTPRTRPAAKRR
jgi:hypothetical protein